MAFHSSPCVRFPALCGRWLFLKAALVGLARDYWKDAPWEGLSFPWMGRGRTGPIPPAALRPDVEEELPAPPPFQDVADETAAMKCIWVADIVQVIEKIWGAGHVLPGGDDYIDNLTVPLGLNEEMSVLDLSAGLGGAARRLADLYGCYVTGFETNPVLAARAMVMSIAAGKSKKASVLPYDPAEFAFSRKYDCVIARELFFRVLGKEKFFAAVHMSLKKRGGQLVFTDFVLDPSLREGPAISAWLSMERNASPMAVAEIKATWQKMGCDLRIAEDQTELYKKNIFEGMKNLTLFLTRHAPDSETKALLSEQLAFWERRLAAMEKGLKYYRFYGITR